MDFLKNIEKLEIEYNELFNKYEKELRKIHSEKEVIKALQGDIKKLEEKEKFLKEKLEVEKLKLAQKYLKFPVLVILDTTSGECEPTKEITKLAKEKVNELFNRNDIAIIPRKDLDIIVSRLGYIDYNYKLPGKIDVFSIYGFDKYKNDYINFKYLKELFK